jgi:hypothetical protein
VNTPPTLRDAVIAALRGFDPTPRANDPTWDEMADAMLSIVAMAVEPYLLALRATVSRAQYAEDRRALAALFDLLDNLGGAA